MDKPDKKSLLKKTISFLRKENRSLKLRCLRMEKVIDDLEEELFEEEAEIEWDMEEIKA